jgi:HEPN domain
MPPDERAREVALQWLGRARSKLALAKQSKPAEAFWEDLCFDAQQAAEKAVKAVLVRHQIDFPKTDRARGSMAGGPTLRLRNPHAVSRESASGR